MNLLNKLRRGEDGAINLTELLIAMVLTVILGYAVFSLLFAAGRTLQGQQTTAAARADIRDATNTIDRRLHSAEVPLSLVNSGGTEMRFVTPSVDTTKFICWRYSVVPHSAGKDELLEQSRTVASAGQSADITSCASYLSSTFTAASTLTMNLNNSAESPALRPFTVVSSPCTDPAPNFTTTCVPAIAAVGVGVVVSLSVKPSGELGGITRSTGSYQSFVTYDYVALAPSSGTACSGAPTTAINNALAVYNAGSYTLNAAGTTNLINALTAAGSGVSTCSYVTIHVLPRPADFMEVGLSSGYSPLRVTNGATSTSGCSWELEIIGGARTITNHGTSTSAQNYGSWPTPPSVC